MEDIKISKELVSEITKVPLEAISEIYFDKTILLIRKTNNRIEQHNIYEFAFKCKEWAYLQYGIIIQSYLYNGKWRVDILKGIEIDEFFKNIDSEPEAIFKACQWILKQIK